MRGPGARGGPRDPDRGYKFSTYCYFWVRKAVLDGVKDCGRTIRLPKYLSEVLRETRKAERDLEAKLGRAPSDVELAEATETDVARVREWRDRARTPLSLDAGARRGARRTPTTARWSTGSPRSQGLRQASRRRASARAEDGPAASAEADADADLLRDALDEALATLLPREQFVLRHRFGLASASARARACASTSDGAPPGWLQASSADEADAMVRAEGKDGASRLLLGSLLGVSAERCAPPSGARWPSSSSPRARAPCCRTWTTRPGRAWSRATRGLFAAALAEAAEKADRRARGGRVFGAVGGAVPASALPAPGGEKKKESAARGEARAAAAATPAAPREESAEARERKSGVPGERRGDGRDDAGDAGDAAKEKEKEKEKRRSRTTIRSA